MKKKYSILSHYRFLYGRLWKYDYELMLLSILESVLRAIKPFIAVLLPAFIIGLLEQGIEVKGLVVNCFVMFLGAGLIYGIADYLEQPNWTNYIFVRLDKFWMETFLKSTNMDYALYETEEVQNRFGKATSAMNSNHVGVEGFYHQNVSLLSSVIGIILYSLVLANVHPLIVLFLLGLSLIQYIFHYISAKYEEKNRDEQARRLRHQKYLFDQSADIKNGKDVRLFQLQHWLTELFIKYNKEYRKQLSKNERLFYLYDFVGLVLNLFRDGICYGYLIYLLIEGMDIGKFVLCLGVVSGFGNWFQKISDEIANLSRSTKLIYHYRTYMDMSDIYMHREGKEIEVESGIPFDVVFEHVSFQYPGSEKKILDDISFSLKKGEKIALVGVNGAGKTTLVKMLCGFYRPTSGRVLVNGIDITELNIDKYFEQISVLFQDSILLSYTIAENIAGQKREFIDREKLQRVLEKSGLQEKVSELPKKADTFIGKDVEQEGVQLSGGQIQKLFLARALYKNSQLLILDEPTAALDAIAESEMYEKYAELTSGKTSIFISHRLSSTRFCDKIFFLENGKIKEKGTHEELLSQNGSYAEMFRVQSQYYVKEEAGCQ